MADKSGSARFHAHFESALQAYEKKAGINLAGFTRRHPTPELPLLRRRYYIVSVLTPLSDALSLAGAIGLVL